MVRYDAKLRSDNSAIHCQDYDPVTGEVLNLVQGQYKDECDLNVILGRLTPEQLEDRLAVAEGVYGDYYNVMSYADAKQLVINAENAFNSLPAKIRKRFDNDPTQFVEFMDDSSNDEEAVALGLKSKVVQPKVESPVPKSDEVKDSDVVG